MGVDQINLDLWTGEKISVFYVVDSWAIMGDEPWVTMAFGQVRQQVVD